ncbi:2,3-bisphosphoglycerate-independent phosphoglycerate mutase [Desulfoluna limicola]|uniref:2,3-bisphosphoglycerate-independent phosphoglycerate mutase n=1 Tax=Desulfoluna limicola TaxID=2810562 RepID=A0ABM7PLX8_9BACT|nr:2,3-bisphosphoglycerate-independent phosphoglycerate mutase [Desulfoluna limicola]BCS98377.1 2,3-bisphosphoglycerate-independent phosphoglycerate mutase [Desulfoluna limicola]
MTTIRPSMLMILDGWGIRDDAEANAVKEANTPNLDALMESYPTASLTCAGPDVGLPDGIMGNSEVGHLNLGAGRVVYQTLLRIDRAIEEGTFFDNEALASAMEAVKKEGTTLHLMGLVSDGGVHSQLTHLMALVKMAFKKGVEKVRIHAILDGRDTPPDSGKGYVDTLSTFLKDYPNTRIATLCGRFYAMDRDTRWERTEEAYQLYTEAVGISETDPVAAVEKAYGRGETDEFVKAVTLGTEGGTIADSDAVIFFNFRADRARQITRALTHAEFDGFSRKTVPNLASYVCMSLYEASFNLPMAFGPQHLEGILGEVVSKAGLPQLRIAETEKYAHVTYFFNGGEETPFENEERCLIPSPRDFPTYDLIPEMSAVAVTDELLKQIEEKDHKLIVVNFANMDMVGHTGIMEAAIKAVETVDACVGRVVNAFQAKGGALLVTADHGNSEQMGDGNGGAHTAHTLNPVPLVLVDDTRKDATLKSGRLADVAPTLLDLMGIAKPDEMTGESLIG